MANWGKASQLPREFVIDEAAIPASPTAVTTVLSEVARISVSNTTAGTITFTATDAAGNPLGNLNAAPIDPGNPASFEFHPPIRCTGGLKWGASGVGLVGSVEGWRVSGWALAASGYAESPRN